MFFFKQNINFILPVFNDIANLLFWVFEQAWLHTSKMILPPCRKLLHLSGGKKSHRPCFSGDITKISKLRILGTLGMPG